VEEERALSVSVVNASGAGNKTPALVEPDVRASATANGVRRHAKAGPLQVSSLEPPTEPVLLHLGCGGQRQAGWINCDLTPGPAVDVTFDLLKPWPFPADCADEIYASHVLEHLHDPCAFFREAWRVLKAGHRLHLRLPYGGHRAAWWDHTHVKPWFAESFCFLQPGYAEAIGNPQHDAWDTPFGIPAPRPEAGAPAALVPGAHAPGALAGALAHGGGGNLDRGQPAENAGGGCSLSGDARGELCPDGLCGL
jgi:SAM-dependent methyltransferase